MPFTIIRQDLTNMNVDAIVNAANSQLLRGGGVCGAIFQKAGGRKLQEACDKLAPVPTGGAVMTPGFNLSARYIIHAVGPVYNIHRAEACEKELRSAYTSSLELAAAHQLHSIAFPLISSGIFGYPKEEALRTATSAIRDFLEDHEMEVYLTIFDKVSFAVSQSLLGEVEAYISDHYVATHLTERARNNLNEAEKAVLKERVLARPASLGAKNLPEFIRDMDEPFNKTLFRLIDQKGMTDAEVYKKANLDRRVFSKIRKGQGYMPGKRTILALAIALELNLDETEALLSRAGYTLSGSLISDVIVQYFIVKKKYDIYKINEVLFQYDQPLLGSLT
jgi:O-acetyl-ADP-ribose deacetylase (regulator of RNase III)